MTRTIETLVPANVNGGDLAPLFANESYTRAANAELAAIDAAEAVAAKKIALDDDYRGTVNLFANATSALRAIGKKFPETGKFVDEAIKQTQLAMSGCVGNPVVDPNAPAPLFPAANAPTPAFAPTPTPTKPITP